MKVNKIEIMPETGKVSIRFAKSLFDAEGNEVFGGYHRDSVSAGNKDKLVELLGQSKADSIEAQYWTEEVLAQQENIASPA